MKVTLIVIGKTEQDYMKEGVGIYLKRLKRYIPFELTVIPDLKNTRKLSETEQKAKEGKMLLEQIAPTDDVVLLDEKGTAYPSVQFARFIEQKMIGTTKKLVFIVGGPYGFSDELYRRANHKISLSKMTFSHQMIRLFFTEQLYRAMTIIKGEPYHHQ